MALNLRGAAHPFIDNGRGTLGDASRSHPMGEGSGLGEVVSLVARVL
jgi:hypothetical protein